jgi:hypothetical protein
MLALVADDLEIPADLRPHVAAVLRALRTRRRDQVSGCHVVAVARGAATEVHLVTREKRGGWVTEARSLGPGGELDCIVREMTEPVQEGRAKVILMGPSGAIYLLGVKVGVFTRGGVA